VLNGEGECSTSSSNFEFYFPRQSLQAVFDENFSNTVSRGLLGRLILNFELGLLRQGVVTVSSVSNVDIYGEARIAPRSPKSVVKNVTILSSSFTRGGLTIDCSDLRLQDGGAISLDGVKIRDRQPGERMSHVVVKNLNGILRISAPDLSVDDIAVHGQANEPLPTTIVISDRLCDGSVNSPLGRLLISRAAPVALAPGLSRSRVGGILGNLGLGNKIGVARIGANQ
jgi:hypothetical protein